MLGWQHVTTEFPVAFVLLALCSQKGLLQAQGRVDDNKSSLQEDCSGTARGGIRILHTCMRSTPGPIFS